MDQVGFDLKFFNKDHLGSIVAEVAGNITNMGSLAAMSAANTEWFSYGAWGEERDGNTWGYQAPTSSYDPEGTTERGSTGHEMLAETGLIHMNGRVFDPLLARFLSPDPHIQAPATNAQNYNRYSYVLNNPLSMSDPSGYFFGSIFKAIGNFVKNYWKPILAIAVGAAIVLTLGPLAGAALPPILGGALTGAVAGFSTGLIMGGIRGALMGAATGAAFGAIGGAFGPFDPTNFGRHLAKTAAHGITGGMFAELQGGGFALGFASAGAAQFAAPGIDLIPGNGLEGIAARVTAAAVVGGTTSEVLGGDFENGAVTGAFSRLFNSEVPKGNVPPRRPNFYKYEDGVLVPYAPTESQLANFDAAMADLADAGPLGLYKSAFCEKNWHRT